MVFSLLKVSQKDLCEVSKQLPHCLRLLLTAACVKESRKVTTYCNITVWPTTLESLHGDRALILLSGYLGSSSLGHRLAWYVCRVLLASRLFLQPSKGPLLPGHKVLIPSYTRRGRAKSHNALTRGITHIVIVCPKETSVHISLPSKHHHQPGGLKACPWECTLCRSYSSLPRLESGVYLLCPLGNWDSSTNFIAATLASMPL